MAISKKGKKSDKKKKKSPDRLGNRDSSGRQASASGKKSNTKLAKPSSARSIGVEQSQPKSVSSVRSTYNLGNGKFTSSPLNPETEAMVLAGEHINAYSDGLYDAVMIYLHCASHKKVALTCVYKKGLFLPYAPIKSSESWLFSAVAFVHQLLGLERHHHSTKASEGKPMFDTPSLVDITRMQLPVCFEFITRVTYKVAMTEHGCKSCCKDKHGVLAWYDIKDIASLIKTKDFYGPEPQLMAQQNGPICKERTMIDLYRKFGINSPEGQVLKDCGYTDADIGTIYSEFIQHTYPSQYMTHNSFKAYLHKASIRLAKQDKLKLVFRAFSLQNNPGYIKFEEFLFGIALLDQFNGRTETAAGSVESSLTKSNGSSPKSSDKKSKSKTKEKSKEKTCKPAVNKYSKLQAEYVFRYYANSDPSGLTKNEFKEAMAKCQVSEADVAKAEQKYFHKDRIEYKDFVHLLEGQVRGSVKSKSKSHQSIGKKKSESSESLNAFPCDKSPLDQFRGHQVYGEIDMRAIDSARERNLNRKFTPSCYRLTMSRDLHFTKPELNEKRYFEKVTEAKRVLSDTFFEKKHMYNIMLNTVRKFAKKSGIYSSNKNFKSIPDWDDDDARSDMLHTINKICAKAQEKFESGPRVVHLSSPCVVFGDIHGNLKDLLTYEKAFWQHEPYLSSCNYLFLGDYVDRGDYSLECILYLLSMKLLAPDRVFLLRGNHETREMNHEFTFLEECHDKFGDEVGPKLCETLNKVFDVLPLVGIIDRSIYCAHGGIPSMTNKLSQIAKVPCPLKKPDEIECPIGSEILWNDPITNKEYDNLVKNYRHAQEDVQTMPTGFLLNVKRNTGSFFSEDALKRFLKANSLTSVIRAHELVVQGFRYHLEGQCLTVFSCSNYCDEPNEAAVAYVNDSKIRVIKVDTN